MTLVYELQNPSSTVLRSIEIDIEREREVRDRERRVKWMKNVLISE